MNSEFAVNVCEVQKSCHSGIVILRLYKVGICATWIIYAKVCAELCFVASS